MKTAGIAWTSLALSTTSLALVLWLVLERGSAPGSDSAVVFPPTVRVSSATVSALSAGPPSAAGPEESGDRATARKIAEGLELEPSKKRMFENIVIDHLVRMRQSTSAAQREASTLSTRATLEANFGSVAGAAMTKIAALP
jgi:hypothetical protein